MRTYGSEVAWAQNDTSMAGSLRALWTRTLRIPSDGGETILKMSASGSSFIPTRFGTTRLLQMPSEMVSKILVLTRLMFSSPWPAPWNARSTSGGLTKNMRNPSNNGGREIMPTSSISKRPRIVRLSMPAFTPPHSRHKLQSAFHSKRHCRTMFWIVPPTVSCLSLEIDTLLNLGGRLPMSQRSRLNCSPFSACGRAACSSGSTSSCNARVA
mmetsp:Transcript_82066/g.211479  ORF Transcript_82066/g.211479 Transcript_82066/m.211479 type:complete len:212 (+) Transcript_82066:1063-1698(+)